MSNATVLGPPWDQISSTVSSYCANLYGGVDLTNPQFTIPGQTLLEGYVNTSVVLIVSQGTYTNLTQLQAAAQDTLIPFLPPCYYFTSIGDTVFYGNGTAWGAGDSVLVGQLDAPHIVINVNSQLAQYKASNSGAGKKVSRAALLTVVGGILAALLI